MQMFLHAGAACHGVAFSKGDGGVAVADLQFVTFAVVVAVVVVVIIAGY